jgi:hypothetical protein
MWFRALLLKEAAEPPFFIEVEEVDVDRTHAVEVEHRDEEEQGRDQREAGEWQRDRQAVGPAGQAAGLVGGAVAVDVGERVPGRGDAGAHGPIERPLAEHDPHQVAGEDAGDGADQREIDRHARVHDPVDVEDGGQDDRRPEGDAAEDRHGAGAACWRPWRRRDGCRSPSTSPGA